MTLTPGCSGNGEDVSAAPPVTVLSAMSVASPVPVATPTTAAVPDVVPDAPVAKPVIQPLSLFGIVPRAVCSPDERGLSGTHAKDANWGVPSGGTNILMVSEKKGYK